MNYLIVGLGNIGFEYQNTRHNIGFSVLEAWANASNVVFRSERLANVTEVRFKGHTFTLVKPTTYMNLSGKAVNYWLQKKNIPIENLLVIVDDMALPLGRLRMRGKGSDGGHNGLKNIAETLGHQNYARLRVGIGDHFGFGSQIDFVLGKWTPEELSELPAIIDRSISAVKAFATIGLARAMNSVNTDPSE